MPEGDPIAVRFAWVFCLVLGIGCLIGGGILGVAAVRQATEASAYASAGACPASVPLTADCRQAVPGTIAGVAEVGGKSPDYAMDVQTSNGVVHVTFAADSPLLGYAVDGDPALVTMWRGIPVSVSADGRTEPTAAVPDVAATRDLGESEQAAGVGLFFVLGALAMRRNRILGRQPPLRPATAAGIMALGLGAAVIAIGGHGLGGRPSRLGPDLAATGAALAVVLGLSGWLLVAAQRRNRAHPAAVGAAPFFPRALRPAAMAGSPTTRAAAPVRSLLLATRWAAVLRGRAMPLVMPGLTVAVLFGTLLTANDGAAARAFRHAPACAGETNLDTCAGDFTATVNGVRTPLQGNGNYADVSYVTSDGVINTWTTFDGDSSALARAAMADENQRTPLTIKVWRGAIVGADLGGSWHWAQGDPPGDTIPAVFLAASFALTLLITRLRVHRRIRNGASAPGTSAGRLLIPEDAGQAAAGAGAIILLGYGFWPAAFLMLAVLLWLALSAWRTRRTAAVRFDPVAGF